VVDILRLDDRLQVVFEDFGEIVLQLRAAEVCEDLLPVGRVLELAEVRLLLPCKHL